MAFFHHLATTVILGLGFTLGFIAVGAAIGFFCWSLILLCHQGYAHIRHLHRIPCHRCQYFTGDYRLKCTVRPFVACTEEAISCRDFAPTPEHETKPLVQTAFNKKTLLPRRLL